MSRLFYQTMQDNAGNLLFDVTGTMRIAGSGTLATIYGDEALTVILPNPMTNHPSFGSFKCFLAAGDYDFYMAKAGYTFETLTGVQGHGTMAQQDASAVNITGGTATLSALTVGTSHVDMAEMNAARFVSPETPGANQTAFVGQKVVGSTRWNLYMEGSALNYLQGSLSLGIATPLDLNNKVYVAWTRGSTSGIYLRVADSDTVGVFAPIVLANLGGSVIGSITTTASATAFNTTSDARLKKAVEPLTGELALVKALRPVSFLWQADDTPGVGFLAHEVAAHVQGVITGEADAVNPDGTINPQMIDYSKLVPWLVGAVQTLAAQIETLTERVTELENL